MGFAGISSYDLFGSWGGGRRSEQGDIIKTISRAPSALAAGRAPKISRRHCGVRHRTRAEEVKKFMIKIER
jgi:hypothetical protein